MTVVERVAVPAGLEPTPSGRKSTRSLERHLEGRLAYPEQGAPRGGVLLLPPHPHLAGDLDNNVIRALGLGLGARGYAALAFNYRGIGESGIDAEDLGEGGSVHDYWRRVESETRYEEITEDAEAARRFLARALSPGAPLHLVGYSFGAAIAALLARDLMSCAEENPSSLPATLTLVAPPIRRYPLPFLGELPIPRLLLLASGDFLYGEEEITALQRLPSPVQVEVVDGTGHFFRGRECEAVDRVDAFLASRSPASSRSAQSTPQQSS